MFSVGGFGGPEHLVPLLATGDGAARRVPQENLPRFLTVFSAAAGMGLNLDEAMRADPGRHDRRGAGLPRHALRLHRRRPRVPRAAAGMAAGAPRCGEPGRPGAADPRLALHALQLRGLARQPRGEGADDGADAARRCWRPAPASTTRPTRRRRRSAPDHRGDLRELQLPALDLAHPFAGGDGAEGRASGWSASCMPSTCRPKSRTASTSWSPTRGDGAFLDVVRIDRRRDRRAAAGDGAAPGRRHVAVRDRAGGAAGWRRCRPPRSATPPPPPARRSTG